MVFSWTFRYLATSWRVRRGSGPRSVMRVDSGAGSSPMRAALPSCGVVKRRLQRPDGALVESRRSSGAVEIIANRLPSAVLLDLYVWADVAATVRLRCLPVLLGGSAVRARRG